MSDINNNNINSEPTRTRDSVFRGSGSGNQSHFEFPFTAGDRDYQEYAHYVADHHIVEIMMGHENWRDFGARAARINQVIDPNVFLLYEKNLSFSVNHEFKSLRGGGGGSGGVLSRIGQAIDSGFNLAAVGSDIMAGRTSGTAGSDLMMAPLRMLNAHYYTGSDSWSFPLEFEFRLGQNGIWDAKTEVFDPVLALLVMCTAIDTGNERAGFPAYEAPGPSQYGLLGSLGTGLLGGSDGNEDDDEGWADRIQDAFRFAGDSIGGGGTAEIGRTLSQNAKSVTLVFGLNFDESARSSSGGINAWSDRPADINYRNIFYFNPCYIERITASFGVEKDLAGYPVSGSVSLDVKTNLPALANDISGIVARNHGSSNRNESRERREARANTPAAGTAGF